MSSLELPTIQRLNSQVIPDLSALDVSREWLKQFASAVEYDTASIQELFLEDGFWRDQLALSWDFRTTQGSQITQYLQDRLRSSKFRVGALLEDKHRVPALTKPFPDLVFLQFSFTFENAVGTGTGTCRLVNSEGVWKAYTVYTALEALKGFPEKVGALRNATIENGDWVKKRADETEFNDESPVALIVGAGHTGLALGARLKALGVRALLVEQKPSVGDNWRDRYKTLSTHDPLWYNRMPYLNYPSTWPIYAPAAKLGNWLESFATSLELDVWTSSKVEHARWDESTKQWIVDIRRNGGTRAVQVKHLVFATGIGGGVPNMPTVPDQNVFKGEVLHSSHFHSVEDYPGKKVIVVGAGCSGHDIAHDFANHNANVTMFQRSATVVIAASTFNSGLSRLYNEEIPTEIADHLSASLPLLVSMQYQRRIFPYLAATVEKAKLDGLEKAGFKTSLGPGNGGLLPLIYERAGGYYLDTGASQHIIDGKIKVKSGGSIERFAENGLRFSDGSVLEADIVIYATGFGDSRDVVKDICGLDVHAKLVPTWGTTSEGEINSVWRESGQERLWFATGNLAISRYASTFLALRIKADEEGLV
ncbi:FAD/NAD(P)-binding domain-containing protein [Fomitopsis serialis]|uniref:FAD/NAD(P)-binding domain-containing protein n=1 Tax=Fomitopsis serialis TaxID=139415 RepID=UPI002008AEA2|nr:FAD/NAD(P)-binding domain-containing protein [Neoantrodia serialis]KAH9929373.1 FAD/NAD(P)-binding domain-containing protein [Neoantrodia serialis]